MGKLERDSAERLLASGRAKDARAAIDRFRTLLSQTPDDPELRARLADAYRLAANPERALHHYDEAARTLTALGRDSLAADVLARALDLAPNETELLFRRAQILERLEQRAELEATCEKLRAIARARGDRRRAWALQRLARLRPGDVALARERARFLEEVDRGDEVADLWEQLAAIRPSGLPEEVEAELEAGLEASPGLRRPLAASRLARGEAEEALAILTPIPAPGAREVGELKLVVRALEAIGSVDDLRVARLALVHALLEAGRPAREEAEQLLVSSPDDPEALHAAAEARLAAGAGSAAAQLWLRLAEHHHQADEPGERDRTLLRVLRAAPDDPQALREAAHLLRATDRPTEAETLEARARALAGPPTPVYGRGLPRKGPESASRPAPVSSPADTIEDAFGENAPDTEEIEVSPEVKD